MQIQPLTSNHSSNEILFDSFVIEKLNSFDELIEIYQEYKQNNAKCSLTSNGHTNMVKI